MSEVHIKVSENGIKLWRTERHGSGVQVRIKGSTVTVADKSEIHEGLTVFLSNKARALESGESNVSDT